MQFPTLGNCSLRAKQPVFRSPDGETSSLRAFRCSPAASLVQGNRPTAAAALQHKVLATSNSRDSSSTEWHKSSLITFRHSLSASLVRGRRPAAAAALQEQKVHAGYKSHDSSTESVTSRTLHRAALGVAASGLTATLLMCPGPVLAADVPQPTQDAQGLSMLLPAGSVSGNLSAAEAPALVADSGSVVLEGVKGMVESGLQDLAANSMAAVGGPVTSDVLSASVSQAASESNLNTAAAQTAPVLQQQQQVKGHRLPAVWCHAWQAYCDALERSPLPTKVYTGVVGTLLGDLAAQILTHQQKQQDSKQSGSTTKNPDSCSSSSSGSKRQGFQFDVLRAGRLCLYSAAIGTPMSHAWYGLLESAVLPSTPLAPAAVAAKVALDQLVQTPFGMALFFAVMKLLEGQPRQVQQELQGKMVPALLANWKLWPAAQLINFTLIPEEQRILYGNIVGICWTCVISNMQQASAAEDAATTTAPAPQQPAVAAKVAGKLAGPAKPIRSQPAPQGSVGEDFILSRRSSSSLAA